ncbi:MAG: hypothetical protein V7694_19490 [Rhodococcus sp. (in: high G+C Gram-positive bacteria)]
MVLSGAATVLQLEQNIAALCIDRDVIAAGGLDIAEIPQGYWGNHSRMART